MTDREKLVEIVCNAIQEVDCISHCNHPPCYKVHHVVDELIAHGVTVREMQKPLTVEELQEDTVCWYEERNDNIVPVEIVRCTSFIGMYFIGWDVRIEEKKWEYGKTWRCWAEKPTEEERKAAEWEK